MHNKSLGLLALAFSSCLQYAQAEVPQMSQQEHTKLEGLLNRVDGPGTWETQPGQTRSVQQPTSPQYSPAFGEPRPPTVSPAQAPAATSPTQELGQFLNRFGAQYAAPLQSAMQSVHVAAPQPNSPWLTNMLHFFLPATKVRGYPGTNIGQQWAQQPRSSLLPAPQPSYGTTQQPQAPLPSDELPALPGDSSPMGYCQVPQGPQNPFNLTPFGMLHYMWDDTQYVSNSNPVALYEVQNDLQAAQKESLLAQSAAKRAQYGPSPQERAQAAQQAQYYANVAKQYAERARMEAGEGSLDPTQVANMVQEEAANAQSSANTAARSAYGRF